VNFPNDNWNNFIQRNPIEMLPAGVNSLIEAFPVTDTERLKSPEKFYTQF